MLDKLPQARSARRLPFLPEAPTGPAAADAAAAPQPANQQDHHRPQRQLGKDEGTSARGRQTLGGLVANYEELVVDREFAEKTYVSALSALERARIEADRQQRYVAAFVRPTLPEDALYPRRIVACITVFAISLVLWALGVLIVYAIRDHAL